MLAPWKKIYDQPRQALKIRDIILPTKVCLVKAMVFPVVTYRCERWTTKKAACRRTHAFKVWCVGEDSCEPLGLQGNQISQF